MKKYSIGRIVISFILFFSLPLAAIYALGVTCVSFDEAAVNYYDYEDLHTFDVTGHSVEKINDNLCIITLNIKNNSAYGAKLYDYTFTVKAGDNRVNYTLVEEFETNLGYYRQNLVVPAGTTVDAHFRVPVQNKICSVVFEYSGRSVNYEDLFGGEDERKYYLVEVDLT